MKGDVEEPLVTLYLPMSAEMVAEVLNATVHSARSVGYVDLRVDPTSEALRNVITVAGRRTTTIDLRRPR